MTNPMADIYEKTVARFNALPFHFAKSEQVTGRFQPVHLEDTAAAISDMLLGPDDLLTAVIEVAGPGSPALLVDEFRVGTDEIESLVIAKGLTLEALASALVAADRCVERLPQPA